MTNPAIYLSAGEPSGDRLGARLATALRAAAPGVRLEGMGGPLMRAAGVDLLHDATGLAANGLVEAAAAWRAHARLLRAVRRQLRTGGYGLAVFVDYPGFHLAAALAARSAGVPVLGYVAPQLWAWGAWRTERVRRLMNQIAVILPFEEAFFGARGVPARFVGHPVLDEPVTGRSAARRALGLRDDDTVLGLFPGSRPAEVARLWPLLSAAAAQVRRVRPDVIPIAAALPGLRPSATGDLRVVTSGASVVAAASDVALCKSGTMTLETALAGTPHVVVYRTHPVTWAVARRVARIPWVGLVNLIDERPSVPEYLQRAATPSALAARALTLLHDPAERERQLEAFARVRARLGSPGVAARVARMALDLVA